MNEDDRSKRARSEARTRSPWAERIPRRGRALALILVAAPAAASTIRPLSPAELAAGADREQDGTVIASWAAWGGPGIETHAVLDDGTEIVVPGGAIGDARLVVFGEPEVVVGERAHWFLRARGDGTYRVYGWDQGVRASYMPPHAEYVTNGMVWPAAKIPVQYLINDQGSSEITLTDEIAAIDAAFATWQAVPCASLAFQNAGMTSLGAAIDGNNVILFVDANWMYGNEAAAATSLWIVDGQQTADISINEVDFHWRISPPDNSIDSNTLDLQAVLTHETGHFSGLGHSQRAYDTMYYSWKPWEDQRHLSYDDKLGLCSVYPVMGDECPPACPGSEQCIPEALGHLCEGQPDPVGTPCNYSHVACDAFCLFTALDLSSGYCSRFCTNDHDCPLTHHCGMAGSGTTMMVCLAGAQPNPGACTTDATCPAGQYCGAGTCTFDCRTDADCGGGATCDARGQCASAPLQVQAGGGGCTTDGRAPLLVLLVLLPLARRKPR